MSDEERINWAGVPDSAHLSCGCTVLDNRLLASPDCTSAIGHPTITMQREPSSIPGVREVRVFSDRYAEVTLDQPVTSTADVSRITLAMAWELGQKAMAEHRRRRVRMRHVHQLYRRRRQ